MLAPPNRPVVLRVVGHLPWLGLCHELERQVSDNP